MKKTSKKKYLITGGSGMIGSLFVKDFRDSEAMLLIPSHNEMDITNKDSIKKVFEKYNPELIIHFAAVRNANIAEKERGQKNGSSWLTNVLGTENLAKVSAAYKSFLINISTDYVFSGRKDAKGPYSEKDQIEKKDNFLSWYGITKREAENKVKEFNKNSAIIRISNVTLPGKISELDYVGKILLLHDQKKLYPLFHDQSLTLTPIPKLFEVIALLTKVKRPGIYHIATTNLTSPHKLANYLIDKTRGFKNSVEKVSIKQFLRKYPRRYPVYGGLKAEHTQKILKVIFPKWEELIEQFVTKE